MDNKKIQIKCSNCEKLIDVDLAEEELYWEIVEADEREMGTESLHEAVLDIDCGECNETITLTLHVWEYPEGFANLQEILVDGGELVGQECDLGDFVI